MKTSKTFSNDVLVNYLALGDIHFGHEKTPTSFIIENLNRFLKINNTLISKTDIIFLQGDIFHRLLSTNGNDFMLASDWVYSLGLYCVNHNIKLRILKGTSSHDWDQIKHIDRALKTLKKELDFMYVQTLHIEYMEKYGIYVLYVPDEYKLKASDTFKDIKKLLIEKGIEKVDIAVMHGNFNYQLPIKLESSHNENDFLNIVKHYITINHIHSASVFDRILAPGSFDRLTHGEEEDKGCIHVTIFKNNDKRFSFIKNPHAMVYKTINCFNMELNNIFNKIRKEVKGIKEGSYIRLLVNSDTRLIKNIEDFSKTFPYLNFKIDNEKDIKVKPGTDIISIDEPIESFHITKDNVEELLLIELEKHNLNKMELDIAVNEIRNCIGQLKIS